MQIQKQLIQQIEFLGQLKKINCNNNVESMFILMIFKKIKKVRLRICQGSVTVL